MEGYEEDAGNADDACGEEDRGRGREYGSDGAREKGRDRLRKRLDARVYAEHASLLVIIGACAHESGKVRADEAAANGDRNGEDVELYGIGHEVQAGKRSAHDKKSSCSDGMRSESLR